MVKVLVIGDSCLDEYIYCTTDRFCPDAPVPIIKPKSYVSTKGMAGNVADNLTSLGAKVTLITNANRIKKTRYVDERTNHMFVRIDEGEDDIFPVAKKTLENIKWDEYDAVVISDYCKGFLTEDYFNKEGIITFENEDDLVEILNNLTEEDYKNRLEAIEENHILALENGFFFDRLENTLDKIIELNNLNNEK
jgi:bifunctional ADP-heptose synthase (sugar kinase/adenylyltransferase)